MSSKVRCSHCGLILPERSEQLPMPHSLDGQLCSGGRVRGVPTVRPASSPTGIDFSTDTANFASPGPLPVATPVPLVVKAVVGGVSLLLAILVAVQLLGGGLNSSTQNSSGDSQPAPSVATETTSTNTSPTEVESEPAEPRTYADTSDLSFSAQLELLSAHYSFAECEAFHEDKSEAVEDWRNRLQGRVTSSVIRNYLEQRC